MRTNPTRFTGWAGKNLADSLAARRHRLTTTGDSGAARGKHLARIEAPASSVKRAALPKIRPYFLHRGANACILDLSQLTIFRSVHGYEATAGNGTMGRLFIHAARGELSGSFFRCARAERCTDAADRQRNEFVGDDFYLSARC